MDDENDDVCFVFQEDEDAKQSPTQLKDLQPGESFMFHGKLFTKKNNYGWLLGVCNIEDAKGQVSHIHPTTFISVLH